MVNFPKKRVTLFIEHLNRQWTKAEEKLEEAIKNDTEYVENDTDDDDFFKERTRGRHLIDFDHWKSLVSEVDDEHFVNNRGSEAEKAFGIYYKSAQTKITKCEIQGNTAYVFAEEEEKKNTQIKLIITSLICNVRRMAIG